MKNYQTEYGTVVVGAKLALFQKALDLASERFADLPREHGSWALTGGSTPKEFYQWLVGERKIAAELLDRVLWTTSDERMAPLESDESNFGNADRQLLSPLDVMTDHKAPWPTDREPIEAAALYAERWAEIAPNDCTYDVCFVGMGDDCHTLSLFPGSPLLSQPSQSDFAAVEVPGKGWRLTLTPHGIQKCGRVVLMTLGSGKAKALRSVLQGDYNPIHKPSQTLKSVADRAYWLVDDAAAADLDL